VQADLTQANLEEADLREAHFENVKIGTFKVRGALTDSVHPGGVETQLAAQANKEQEEFKRRMNEPSSDDAPELPLLPS
jgi:uncharacterized protein YjbI with pentapeptide repeats